jgi:hypothetical protein
LFKKDVVSVFSEFLKLPKIGVKHQTLNAWRCWKKRFFKALINYQLTVHFDPRFAEVLVYILKGMGKGEFRVSTTWTP